MSEIIIASTIMIAIGIWKCYEVGHNYVHLNEEIDHFELKTPPITPFNSPKTNSTPSTPKQQRNFYNKRYIHHSIS
jgi:hypothetical protein